MKQFILRAFGLCVFSCLSISLAQTPGTIPKFTDSLGLGDSIIVQDGGSVGIISAPEQGTTLNVQSADGFAIKGISQGEFGTGIFGAGADAGTGVLGASNGGSGVQGQSTYGSGVQGESVYRTGVSGFSVLGDGMVAGSTRGAGLSAYSTNGQAIYASSVYGSGIFTATVDGGTPLVAQTLATNYPAVFARNSGTGDILAGANSSGVVFRVANNGDVYSGGRLLTGQTIAACGPGNCGSMCPFRVTAQVEATPGGCTVTSDTGGCTTFCDADCALYPDTCCQFHPRSCCVCSP